MSEYLSLSEIVAGKSSRVKLLGLVAGNNSRVKLLGIVTGNSSWVLVVDGVCRMIITLLGVVGNV